MTHPPIRRPRIAEGERFGKLTVVGRNPKDSHRVICKCDCGGDKDVWASNLTRGLTENCGCETGTHRKFLEIVPCLLQEVWR